MSSLQGRRVVPLLWMAVVMSALAVAWVNHLCRERYALLAGLEREAMHMQQVYRNFLLEQSAWGSLQRIETMAAENLAMKTPAANEIILVDR